MANNPFRRFDGIQLRPRYSADPIQGKLGEIYYNTTFNSLRLCTDESPLTWSDIGIAAGTITDSTLRWSGSSWVQDSSIRHDGLGKIYSPDASTGEALRVQTGAATLAGNDGGALYLTTGAGLGAGDRGILYFDTDIASQIADAPLLTIQGGPATIGNNNGGDITVRG